MGITSYFTFYQNVIINFNQPSTLILTSKSCPDEATKSNNMQHQARAHGFIYGYFGGSVLLIFLALWFC